MGHSIRNRLIVAFIALATIPLLVVGIITGVQTFNAESQQALILQHQIAAREANQIHGFFQELENALQNVIQDRRLMNETLAQQHIILSGLLSRQSAFDKVFLLNSRGQEIVGVSRSFAIASSDLVSRADADEFRIPATTNTIYYSPVRTDDYSGEPIVTVAIPIEDLVTGQVEGVLVADLRFVGAQSLVVDEVSSDIQTANSVIYLVDSVNRVVAHNDPSVTLRGVSFTPPAKDAIQNGLSGDSAVLATAHFDLGDQRFTIVAETPVSQALALAINTAIFTSVLILITLVISIIVALWIVNQIVKPISALAVTAQAIRLGDFSKRADVNRHDEIGQFAAAFNDMTDAIQKRESDLIEQAESLRIATARAKEAARIKGEFLANVSHELRTPLNAIIGFSDMLLVGMSGPLNDKQQHKMERLKENGERLLALINDLLDLTRIESGRIEMIEKPFSPRALTERITAQMESLAVTSKLRFETNINPAVPDMINGDEKRVEQVLVNLLSNAFKFTKEGSVTLNIDVNHEEKMWVLSVTDTGIGIPPHAVNIIFEEFRQLDGSYSRAYKGSGLGLAITRNLVRMMGGKISVKSVVGSGSTFTVLLPLAAQEPVTPAMMATP